MDVRYSDWRPGAELEGLVTAYWFVEGDGRAVPSPAILPDGHVEIVSNHGDPAGLAGPAFTGDQPERAVVGPLSRAVQIEYRGRVRLCGARLHPACGSSFFNRAACF